MMKAIFLSAVVYGLLAVSPSIADADTVVSAGLPPQMYPGLRRAFGLPSDAPDIIRRDQCLLPGANELIGKGRANTEFSILCNALFEARLADTIKLIHQYPHRRRLSAVSAGKIDVSATTIFPEGMANVVGDTKALLSQPVLEIGDYEKAVFTLPDRNDVLAVDSLEKLRRFKAIMVKNWRVDVKTLDGLGLAGVVKVSKSKAYHNMLKSRRADFTISEFTSIKNSIWAKGMARVPGIKIALASPRVFPVSPQRPDVLAAINAYIGRLKAADPQYVRKLFVHAGFIKPEFADWKLLNPTRNN